MSVVKLGVTEESNASRSLSEDDISQLGLPTASYYQGSGAKSWIKRFPAKRSFDLIVSSMLLILLSPLLLAIALILRLSSKEAVIFVQQRVVPQFEI